MTEINKNTLIKLAKKYKNNNFIGKNVKKLRFLSLIFLVKYKGMVAGSM
jgi:hypothetical protein